MEHLLLIVLQLLLFEGFAYGSTHVFKEAARVLMRHDITKMRRASHDLPHTVIFAITQLNLDQLRIALFNVSDPHSPNYGKHWTQDEVGHYTQNIPARDAVRNYLFRNRISIVHETPYGEYITATASVKKWEAVFNTQFHHYHMKNIFSDSSNDDGVNNQDTLLIRTHSYSLPMELLHHVTAVYNTVQFPYQRNKKRHVVDEFELIPGEIIPPSCFPTRTLQSKNMTTGCKGYVTPQFLYDYYNISQAIGSILTNQGVYESNADALNPDDLLNFELHFNLSTLKISNSEDIGVNIASDACTNPAYEDCTESNLDVEYIMAIAQNVPTTYYNTNDSWASWITAVASVKQPLRVFSISYGSPEASTALSDMQGFNTEAMKLGIRGTTIIAASGDDGASAYLAVNGKNSLCGYYPFFPASSPYVTAVGGTSGPESGKPEIACISNTVTGIGITSGGGFSHFFAAPSFQQSVINAYFSHVKQTYKDPYFNSSSNIFESIPGAGVIYPLQFNSTNRGYPDVALLAHNYIISRNGSFVSVDGTSASAPVFAGMVSLVNNARLQAGSSSMGWLNPFLYQYYQNFTRDIEDGDKNNCSALQLTNRTSLLYSHTCCAEGFYPTVGWDPVTGLGSIKYDLFLQTAMKHAPFPSSSSNHRLTKGETIGVVIAVLVVTAAFLTGLYQYEH